MHVFEIIRLTFQLTVSLGIVYIRHERFCIGMISSVAQFDKIYISVVYLLNQGLCDTYLAVMCDFQCCFLS